MKEATLDPTEKKIASLSHKWQLLPLHRVLLGHDGSMTRLLELIVQEEVALRTLRQCVVPCPQRAARLLGVRTGEPSNERDITISRMSDAWPLLYARSYTPLSRLKPSFRSDLMRADIPIGRILQEHQIEARREILEVGFKEQDEEVRGLLRKGGPYLWRTYNIITENRPLIMITETFSALFFAETTQEAVKMASA